MEVFCQSNVGIYANQLQTYSISQQMSTAFYTRWDVPSETTRLTPRQYKTPSFEN